MPSSHSESPIEFVRESSKQTKACTLKPETGQLGEARDRRLVADQDQRLRFPAEIAVTNLRPDLVLWSSSCCTVYIIELTVPWEDAMEEAYDCKSLKYAELTANTEQHGRKAKLAAEACSGNRLPGCLKTLKYEAKPNSKPLKPSLVLTSEQVSGLGSRGETRHGLRNDSNKGRGGRGEGRGGRHMLLMSPLEVL